MTNSRTIQVYRRLRTDIVSGRHRPGTKLKIDALGEDLGISPGAVREALSRLCSEGLVVSQPQRGFIVAPVSIEDLLYLTEVRITVESICVRRSIEKGDIAWEARIIGAWEELQATPAFAPDPEKGLEMAWNEAHGRLHAALTSACDNHWWLRFREQLFVQSERYRQLSAPLAKHDRNVEQEHRELVEMTLARNSEAATKLLADHLQRTTDILLARSLLNDEDHR